MPSGVTLREYAALLYPTGSMTCEIRSLAAVGAVTEPESWTTNHPKSRERGSRARRAVLLPRGRRQHVLVHSDGQMARDIPAMCA